MGEQVTVPSSLQRWLDTLRCLRQGRFLDPAWLQAIGRSEWFDAVSYAQQAGHPAWLRSEVHYLVVGVHRVWPPSVGFDPERYLRANPDVAASKIPALVHFVLYGEQEGRQPITADKLSISRPPADNGLPTYFGMPE